MTADKPQEELASGILSGDFVPLSVPEFQKAYSTAIHVVAGALPPDPTFPTGTVLELEGFPTKTLRDTPQDRAAYAAGATFTEGAKQASFYWRSRVVMDVAEDKRFRKYVDWEAGTIHAALLAAICTVRGNMKTTKKALWAAVAAEFERHMATGTDETVPLLVPVAPPVVRH